MKERERKLLRRIRQLDPQRRVVYERAVAMAAIAHRMEKLPTDKESAN